MRRSRRASTSHTNRRTLNVTDQLTSFGWTPPGAAVSKPSTFPIERDAVPLLKGRRTRAGPGPARVPETWRPGRIEGGHGDREWTVFGPFYLWEKREAGPWGSLRRQDHVRWTNDTMAARSAHARVLQTNRRRCWKVRCAGTPLSVSERAEEEAQKVLRGLGDEQRRGKVAKVNQQLAIVEGVDMEVPLGVELGFEKGAKGMLLMRFDYTNAVALITSRNEQVSVGEEVEASAQLYQVEAGREFLGRVVDHDGKPLDGKSEVRSEKMIPMLNAQPDVGSRQKIHENLHTGLCGVDALAPIGRGQTMPFIGPKGSGKSQALMDAVCAQKDSGVYCVYASLGQPEQEFAAFQTQLHENGAITNTAIVRVTEQSKTQQFLGMCRALCIAEYLRDEGKHCLLVVDDFTAPVQLWKEAWNLCQGDDGSNASEEKMIEYEGMMVSEQMAIRRQFISMLIQRAAKMNDLLGAGSLTFLMAVEGMPASIISASQGKLAARGGLSIEKVKSLKGLNKQQRQALLSAIEKRKQEEDAKQAIAEESKLSTDYIEELKSLADGQIVFDRNTYDPSTRQSGILSRESLSRIGNKAYHPAIRDFASSLRLDMNQSFDEQDFGDPTDPINSKRQLKLQQVDQFLRQRPGDLVLPEEIAVGLFAIQNGYCANVKAPEIKRHVKGLLQQIQVQHPHVLETLYGTSTETSKPEEMLAAALKSLDHDQFAGIHG
eukprot:scaffold128_cov328-Pavlova_lutheri.AAC.30